MSRRIKKIKRYLRTAAAALMLCGTLTFSAEALSPSNSGLTGLWEYPTAEMPGDGKGFMHYSYYTPYKAGGVSMGLFPWLEFNIRITEFENAAKISDNYGYYKDKALDLKLLLINQRGLIPSVAVGTLDMMGTEIRKAYFGAGTWKYNNIALTLGYATDTYNGFYGGISWAPAEWIEFKAEYSPLDYTKDRIVLQPKEAEKKYNYGVVLKSPIGLNGSISYQRGEEFCFGINYSYDFTKPLFGGKNKVKLSETPSTDWADTDIEKMASSLQKELGKKGFGLRNVVVLTGDKKVHVAFENIGYSSQTEGTVRTMILAAGALPWDTELFSCSPMVRGEPVTRIELNREQISLIRLKKFNAYDLSRSSVTWAPKTKYGTLPGEDWNTMAGPGESINNGTADIRVALSYEPRIDKPLDKNFYMDRINIDYIGRLRTSKGFEAYLKVRQPIDNDIDIWWQPEINDDTRINKGVLSYVYKMDKNLWALGEAGWIDELYFGANIWGRWFIKDSPFWIGARASVFKERDVHSFAGLADYKTDSYPTYSGYYYGPSEAAGNNDWAVAYWGEAGYHDKIYNADLIARYGKFADSDKGYRLDAIRNWDSASVGFYYTVTDRKTSDKGYTDAGMMFNLPLTFWYDGHATNTYWDEEFTLLSTFRLFAGRIPGAWMTPEKLIGELTPNRLSQELAPMIGKMMKEVRDDSETELSDSKTYGIWEFLHGEWRMDEALKESE